jgi:hypothetical protein
MPAGQGNSTCHRCHAKTWLASQESNGKGMAMNCWTSEKGTYYAVDPEAPTPMVHYIGKGSTAPEGSARYFPHFITCAKKPGKK